MTFVNSVHGITKLLTTSLHKFICINFLGQVNIFTCPTLYIHLYSGNILTLITYINTVEYCILLIDHSFSYNYRSFYVSFCWNFCPQSVFGNLRSSTFSFGSNLKFFPLWQQWYGVRGAYRCFSPLWGPLLHLPWWQWPSAQTIGCTHVPLSATALPTPLRTTPTTRTRKTLEPSHTRAFGGSAALRVRGSTTYLWDV